MTPSPLPNTRQDPSGAFLALIWRALRKHWWLVMAVTAAVTVVTSFYIMGRPKVFRASMTVKIDPVAIRPLGRDVQTPGDSSEMLWATRDYYETQYKIIRSRAVAETVVRQLSLHRDSAFLSGLPATPGLPPANATIEGAAGVIQGALTVEPIKNSRMVLMTFDDADPIRARRILAAVADAYIQQNLDAGLASVGNAGEWLNTQLAKLKTELEASELALHEYKKGKQLLSVSLDDQSNMLRNEMVQLDQALTEARTKRERLAARIAQLNRVNPDDPTWLPASELLDNSVLAELRSTYVAAQTQFESLTKAGKGLNHPEVQSVEGNLSTARAAVIAEVKNIQESNRRDLTAAEQEIGGLSGLYGSAKQRALDLNLLEIEYGRLERNKENTQRLYSLVLERAKESDLATEMRFNNISVVDSPLVPGSPIKPLVSQSIALGLFGGLLLGLMVVFAREAMDRTVKTPTDVEHELGLTCLGLLPQIGQQESPAKSTQRRRRAQVSADSGPPELHLHHHPTSGAAEAMRAVRTNIFFMSPDKPFERLLVTSAGPAEGKTTVACSLAIAIAQSGKSVVLVDADLRRPRLRRIFGIEADRGGVTNALLDASLLDECVTKSDVPNLSILPTGPVPPNPSELLHSASFQRLLDSLSKRFDRVVIDSPPLVPVTDAAILSTLVDTTVVVVRGFKTRKDLARQAVRSLRDVNAPIAGVLLNDIDLTRGEYGYYQYYSYKGGGYASTEASEGPATQTAG